MSNLVENPYPTFKDANGEPLEDGFIFIGEPGLSPISNPMQAYWDTNFTVPANDIRTKGGYPYNSGSPGRLYTDGNYSILVQDRIGTILYSQLNSLDYSNALTAGTVSSVDTLEDLRNIVSGEAYVQMSVAGSVTPGDGLTEPLYFWEPTSVAADNGTSVIKPFTVTGAGRWLWKSDFDGLPIGFVYTQYPGKLSPSVLGLPGTWVDISSEFAGNFFRAEGGAASTFEAGEQTYATNLKSHTHTTVLGSHTHASRYKTASETPSAGSNDLVVGQKLTGITTYGLNSLDTQDLGTKTSSGPSVTDAETRPVNRTIRLWERTA